MRFRANRRGFCCSGAGRLERNPHTNALVRGQTVCNSLDTGSNRAFCRGRIYPTRGLDESNPYNTSDSYYDRFKAIGIEGAATG